MILGIIVGAILSPDAGIIAPPVDGETPLAESFKPIGTLFINMIKMLVVPLIFFSLISGVTSMRDPKVMGRVGLKAFGVYMITTVFAIAIGLFAGYIIQPGAGVEIVVETKAVAKDPPSFVNMILSLVPTNPIEALAEGKILQIIFFSIMCGISLVLIGKKADKIIEINESLSEMMFKMTHIVMAYAPIGVFGLMVWITGTQGIEVLLSLGKLVIAFMIGLLIHIIFVYGTAIKVILKLSPIRFIQNIGNALAVAFSTSSSSATLPVTMEVAEENLGVSNESASFVLPLGATINMDGTALYQGVCVMFVAQAMQIDLSMADWITVIMTSTLASIGVAGIPGAGIVMLGMVLSSVGLPVEAVAIIIGVDRILDMMRTAINVTGDSFVCTLVDKSEGKFNEKIFYQENKE